ncbi:MAG: hypothetical protein CM1200mP30_21620 [Pseudomonadota bacterium]|nr:MAG: hypothetical protein CM1200mP30_21620 [Pseudomonadota bacterium]
MLTKSPGNSSRYVPTKGLYILDTTTQTIDALMRLDISAGVDIAINRKGKAVK